MSKKVAISQSNYIPWKGYFDNINAVDVFVLFDDAQFTKRDWRNRNMIKTGNGLKWLTIPVQVKGKYFQKINETVVSEEDWGKKHWRSIHHAYSKAPFFKQYAPIFEELYRDVQTNELSLINRRFIECICGVLGIKTELRWSSEFDLVEDKNQRLINVCQQVSGTVYISGPSAQQYMDESAFEREGIQVRYFDYSGYPEYSQLNGPFEHAVTVLDLIFNEGENATKFMKTFQGGTH